MGVFIDQVGKKIVLDKNPVRIVSLVPSQTELLFDLGLRYEVCGITKFCIHPDEWFRTKTRIGGTKKLNTDIIRKLNPDLIIANKEENVKEQVDELSKDFPVWTSDVNDLASAYEMINLIGVITGHEHEANELTLRIKENFSKLQTANHKLKTAYLIWQKPYMTVGGDTFIHSMLGAAGFENIFSELKRYPEINLEQLPIASCQLIFLSSEPFPFKEKHVKELQKQLPGIRVICVDGEMFSWYGSRLLKAPGYFRKLIKSVSE